MLYEIKFNYVDAIQLIAGNENEAAEEAIKQSFHVDIPTDIEIVQVPKRNAELIVYNTANSDEYYYKVLNYELIYISLKDRYFWMSEINDINLSAAFGMRVMLNEEDEMIYPDSDLNYVHNPLTGVTWEVSL